MQLSNHITPSKMGGINTPSAASPERTKRFARRGKFRFMDLPPELRNTIYHLALDNEQNLRLKRRFAPSKLLGARVFPLMRASKTTHREAFGVFYANLTKPFPISTERGALTSQTQGQLQKLSNTALASLRRLRFVYKDDIIPDPWKHFFCVHIDLVTREWSVIEDEHKGRRHFAQREYASTPQDGPSEATGALLTATFGAEGKVGVSIDQIRDFAAGMEDVAWRFRYESTPIRFG